MSNTKINIEGREFNIMLPRGDEETSFREIHTKTLSECYVNYSDYKFSVYMDWLVWESETPCIKNLGICGYNNFRFTLAADVVDRAGSILGRVYITRDKQEFYPNPAFKFKSHKYVQHFMSTIIEEIEPA